MDADRNARPAKGASLDSEELAQLATEVLAKSPFPALVVSMPSAKIVAASPHAIELLNPEGGKVLGRLLQESMPTGLPAPGTCLPAGVSMDSKQALPCTGPPMMSNYSECGCAHSTVSRFPGSCSPS